MTGQYYLRARYYNPVVGRFLQEDTYRGDGLNLYAYCANNPVRYYDPSGHDMEGYDEPPQSEVTPGGDISIDGLPRDNHQVFGDRTSLAATGQPVNSSADLLNPDGSVKQRKYYDADGKAEWDIDYNHTDDGTHNFPYIYIWDWSKKPPRQDSRG